MKIVLAGALRLAPGASPAGAALVEPGGAHLRALLLAQAVESRPLYPDTEVYAVIKATWVAYLETGWS
jgi:hypothetical protein